MLPFNVVYHSGYDLNLGDHVFPSTKFRLIYERLLKERVITSENVLTPEPASLADLKLAHDEGWIDRLEHGTLSYQEILRLEIPYSRKMVEAFWLHAGGSVLAAHEAVRNGMAYNIGGGFHHAYPGHGEGFCPINDVAVGIRVAQRDLGIRRAMVVDCDCHQGNGTAAIFADDSTVFTLSIHQLNNYPSIKPPSNIDINLDDYVSDDEYLTKLRAALEPAIENFQPHMIAYVAGSDPYEQDKLGGLSLTVPGMRERDRLVFDLAFAAGAKVFVTLAGGYAVNVEDTVTIHSNTVKAARDSLAARQQ